jgi:hypothetical protein
MFEDGGIMELGVFDLREHSSFSLARLQEGIACCCLQTFASFMIERQFAELPAAAAG